MPIAGPNFPLSHLIANFASTHLDRVSASGGCRWRGARGGGFRRPRADGGEDLAGGGYGVRGPTAERSSGEDSGSNRVS